MENKITIGVDLGGTNLKLALISDKGHIIKKISIPTSDFNSKNSLINAITENIISIYQGLGYKKANIIGVGIGVPGLVDHKKGIVKTLTNLEGWNNVELKKILEKRLGLRVFVDNDVNVITLGEYYFRKDRNVRNFIGITLGTGVGGGIILDGKLYRGSTGSAGEIGHVPLNEAGPKCNCGGFACLETYVGNNYIIRDVVARLNSGQKSEIANMVNGDFSLITPAIISLAVKKNDTFSKSIWRDAGIKIGIALAGIINFLDVDLVVIGGGLSKAGNILFDSIRATVKERAMKIQSKNVKIEPSSLNDNAGLLGAMVLVKENIKI